MAETRNIAPVKLELLLAVVHDEKAAYYSSLIQSYQANLQVKMVAKGTTHLILSYLGMMESPKTLLISVIRMPYILKLRLFPDKDTMLYYRFSLSKRMKCMLLNLKRAKLLFLYDFLMHQGLKFRSSR